MCGRPKLSSVVGYQAIKESEANLDVTTLHAKDYDKLLREEMVQFYNKPFSAQPFVGIVVGKMVNINPFHF